MTILLRCASLVAADKISVTETTHALLGRAKVEGIAFIRHILSLPLIAEGIDLVGETCQLLIRQTLVLVDNGEQALSGSKQAGKYIAGCLAGILGLLRKHHATALLNAGIVKQIVDITAVRCNCLIAQFLIQMRCKVLCDLVIAVYNKNTLWRILFE